MDDADTDDQPPNVVLITAHDMGRYLGCYGRQAHTPALDALAEEGALFEESFCTTPHCAPSRASIQTGLLPHNHGMMSHPIRGTDTESPRREPYKGWEIHEGIRTLPMYLNERGYDTHLAVYQHASGIAENTLVVFTTDHGIDIHPKGKGTCYDPGIETALLMCLPGRIEAGARHGDLASNVDILPTVLDLLDFDVPYGLDGQSLRPLLEGTDGDYGPRDAVFAETTWFGSYVPTRIVRTEEHKYVRNFWPRRIPAAEGHDRDTEVELYDLAADPGESQNCADDPEYADFEAALHARLARKLRADDDPIVDGPIPPKPGLFDVTLREPTTIDGGVIDGCDD